MEEQRCADERRRLQESQRTHTQLETEEAPQQDISADDGPCFTISKVIIDGASLLSEKTLRNTYMIQWSDSIRIYLHRDPVDFRKAINGLALIVGEEMALDVYDSALFVFCNKSRSQLKVLYWGCTGFALWQKRLEKDKFKWPRKDLFATVVINHEQWCWLLRGFNLAHFKPHKQLNFTDVN